MAVKRLDAKRIEEIFNLFMRCREILYNLVDESIELHVDTLEVKVTFYKGLSIESEKTTSEVYVWTKIDRSYLLGLDNFVDDPFLLKAEERMLNVIAEKKGA